MMRRRFNIVLSFVLVLSCWGGALSAAPCPHGCHAATLSGPHSHVKKADHCHSTEADDSPSLPADAAGQAMGDSALRVSTFGLGFSSGEFVHGLCDHCVGRGEAPSSSFAERESVQPRKDGAADAPVVARVERTSADFVREIIPYEEGPPPTGHRLALLGVFRI